MAARPAPRGAQPAPSAPAPGGLTPPMPRRAIILLLVALGMFFFFIPLSLFGGAARSEVRKINADLQLAQANLQALKTPGPEAQELLKQLEQMRASVATINQVYAGILSGWVDWPAVMEAIADFNPDRIYLSSLAQQANQVTLSGQADSDAVVVSYARSLEQTGLFSRVIVRSIRAVGAPFATPSGAEPGVVITPGLTLTPTLTATPTPDLRDAYEPDDFAPQEVYLAQAQTRSFYPLYDVDTIKFLAKAGRYYRVATTGLAPGVDTFLTVALGPTTLTNDDRAPADVSSEVLFRVASANDMDAIITVTNRGKYGPDATYTITVVEDIPTATPVPSATGQPTATLTETPLPTITSTATPIPTITNTPDLRDAYEPDDNDPKPIAQGETQAHTFYPNNDVDKVRFIAKAGRWFKVATSELASGVDTLLVVYVAGQTYTNDDRVPGDSSSEIIFQLNLPNDAEATVEIYDRGQYGPTMGYKISVVEVVLAATPTRTLAPTVTPTVAPSNTPDLRDAYEPDDAAPRPIALGETQTHNFFPLNDKDYVTFLAKAGRSYQVKTFDLAIGADTALQVYLNGALCATCTNDDRTPGDPASELVFTVGAADQIALVEITNRGQFGPGYSYKITASEVAITPAPSATPDNTGDAYEPDDLDAKFIAIGETQTHTFFPQNDVDRAKFLAKAGRYYQVHTSGLALGVDTKLQVYLDGAFYAESDDMAPGNLASSVGILVGAGSDVWAEVMVLNRGVYGVDKQYSLTLTEFALTPTPSAMNPRRGPGLAAWWAPLGRRLLLAQQQEPPTPQLQPTTQPTPPAAQPPAASAVEFIIVLELKLEEPPATPTPLATPTVAATATPEVTPTQGP